MIFTLGHSSLSLPQIRTLLANAVRPVIWDIRSHPGSSTYPHLNKEVFDREFKYTKVRYLWEPHLGGWTDRHRDLIPRFPQVDVAAYCGPKFPKNHIAKQTGPADGTRWSNLGFWDYQWFMTLPEFHEAALRLKQESKNYDIAIMCAELLWWKCHRSMVADYMCMMGCDVTHLQPRLTKHVVEGRMARYEKKALDTMIANIGRRKR